MRLEWTWMLVILMIMHVEKVSTHEVDYYTTPTLLCTRYNTLISFIDVGQPKQSGWLLSRQIIGNS